GLDTVRLALAVRRALARGAVRVRHARGTEATLHAGARHAATVDTRVGAVRAVGGLAARAADRHRDLGLRRRERDVVAGHFDLVLALTDRRRRHEREHARGLLRR